MRRATGLLVLPAFAGVLTAVALGNQARGAPLPTVQLPTVTLPSLPATTPAATVPKPDPPPIVTVPAAPPPAPAPTTAAAPPTPSGPAARRRHRRKARRPTVSFRLRAPARVVFTAYGPSPTCGVAATKTVRGRRGMNRIPVTRHFGRWRLEPGTYRVDVVSRHRHIDRTGMQVPRRGRARRAAAPVLHCSAGSAATLGLSHSSSSPTPQEGLLPPRRDLREVPLSGLPLGNGSGGLISLSTLQLALLAAILLITGTVVAYTVRFYRRIENP
jgi:hypothetical protein